VTRLAGDEAKNASTRRERGFGFEAAARVFDGPTVEWCDIRGHWGEERVVAIGAVRLLILAVVYTNRGAARRIISVRVARKKEAELWQWSAKL
jgi:hypothetical protein